MISVVMVMGKGGRVAEKLTVEWKGKAGREGVEK